MLVDILRKYQGSLGQNEYARLLGVSGAAISLIYSGQRGVGVEVLRGLAQRFPESADEIAAALSTITPAIEREAIPA